MKNKRISVLLSAGAVSCVLFLYCTRCTPLSVKPEVPCRATVVSYNVQTFFDAVEDGTEFKEFKGSKSRWTEQKYLTRLERLKQTLFNAGEKLTGNKDRLPDITVLQEVESIRVVEDFCKQLPSSENYPYALCPPLASNDAFTTVVLSKYPIEDFTVHYIHTQDQARLRPLTEAVINLGGGQTPRRLKVFSVHWKSKSGKTDSNAVRIMQEAQLVQKIADHRRKDANTPFIVCGDFNQPLEEFQQMDSLAVCWEIETYKTAAGAGMQPGGSYYFEKKWEKIDHIFYEEGYAGLQPADFFVLYEPPLIHDGTPLRYNVITGEGYSDHLPLAAAFELPQ
ncbi:MAG: endonuclease/exonuclease/phosphatase family protein [Treponema sp.]